MESLQQLVFKVATEAGHDEAFARLLFSIVMIESSGIHLKSRAEPKYKWLFKPEVFAVKLNQSLETETQAQKTSYGLGQIMGAVPREYGFSGYLPELYDKTLNLKYAAKHLARLMRRFPIEEEHVSSYNQGNPDRDENGVLKNIEYVRKVLTFREKHFAAT